MKLHRPSAFFVLLAALGAANGETLSVASCAGGGQPLELAADARAVLDEADRREVHEAMLARYPMLARDGFVPQQIVLWHKTADEWLYVSLSPDPDRPGRLCFTATFAAEGFEFTKTLAKKYFFAGTSRT